MKRLITLFLPPLGSLIIAVLIFVLGAMTPGYDPSSQFISELGAKGAPYALVMNWLGILPFGLGIIVFGLGFMKNSSATVRARVGGALVIFAGVGFTLAALFSCDEGCRFNDLSLSAQIHNFAAFGAFVILPPAVILIAFARFRQTQSLALLAFETALLAAMSLGLGLLFTLGPVHEFTGAAQRLFIFALAAWVFAMSLLPLINGKKFSNNERS